jgi:hypothetical protein
MLPARLPVVLLLALLPASPAAQVDALLDRARRAVGIWAADAGVLAGRGQARVAGAEGELSLLLGPGGLFRSEVRSELSEWSGFDGELAWTRDRTGLERRVELEEADRARLLHAVLGGQWLDAPAIEKVAAPDDTRPGDELALGLAGSPLAMTLTLDAESGLPVELAHASDGIERRWTFADFRAVGALRLPHRWTFSEGPNEDRYVIESFRPVAPAEAVFAAALAPPDDVRFEADVAGELTVARGPTGHLVVEPLLEGESRGPFVLDTGAGITVIDRRVADELVLETLGTTVAIGVVGSTTSDYRRGERFQLGPLVLADPIYGDLDLGFLPPAGSRRLAGIVGYDLFARCVVELEPATPRVVLHDPARFELTGAAWQPLVLHQNQPCVRARYEARPGVVIEGLFRLDSGASGTLTFHTPAVEAHRLLEGRTVRETRVGGVGGSAPALAGELAWFELAGQRFERPQVEFSRVSEGAFADLYTDGNIGLDFLQGFRIVLDYGDRRIALVPLAR